MQYKLLVVQGQNNLHQNCFQRRAHNHSFITCQVYEWVRATQESTPFNPRQRQSQAYEPQTYEREKFKKIK